MSAKTALKAQIEASAAAASAGLVVYLGGAPQRAAMPYGVIERVGPCEFPLTQSGASVRRREVFELDLFGTDDAALETIREGIITALHGAGPATWSSLAVKSCSILGGQDYSGLVSEGTETRVYAQTLDIALVYQVAEGS